MIPDWLFHVKLIPVIGMLQSGSLTVNVEANLCKFTYIRWEIDCNYTDALVIWNLGIDEVIVDPSE
jgi:hypothetical protein